MPQKRQLPKKSDSNVPPNAMESKQIVEVCDAQVQVTPPEKQTAELGVQTDKVPELSSAEKRMALAKDLSVDLDAVDEYLRVKKERQRLRTAGEQRLCSVLSCRLAQSNNDLNYAA
jgi:hypothetical protein